MVGQYGKELITKQLVPSNTTIEKFKNLKYRLCWESRMIESNNLSYRMELSEPDRNPEFKLPVHLLSR
jgi:hypothetical protein